jgi:beta-glucosidase
MGRILRFPEGFQWGVSTAAYQIEGAVHADGREDSIWDVFSHTPGKIKHNDTGDEADDSYHLWQQDIDIMHSLGVKAYRFSVAWPRIFPSGTGERNEAGLAYYDRLVDGLLAARITPVVTLYHWDLPAALPGAWLSRSTPLAFVNYVDRITRQLGDRVKQWTTLNEPFCASFTSYAFGIHAPGERDLAQALQAAHNLMLAHGLAVPVIRANVPDARVSIVMNPASVQPATDSAADRNAARYCNGLESRWLLDPLYGRGYPTDMQADFERMGVWKESPDYIQPGDMQIIAAPLDLLGVNYYSRQVVAADPVQPEKPEFWRGVLPTNAPRTEFGWEIYPQGLYDLLAWLKETYAPKSLFIAENGASYSDGPDATGAVHDTRRVIYLHDHLVQLARAIEAGIPVEGYFHWSLLDNFEWSEGYSQRFGLVHVDFDSPDKKRTIKDSALYYKQVIAANSVE